jgi:hypothetical protein
MNPIEKQKQKIINACDYKLMSKSRLMIYVRNVGHYYDVGIRALEDPLNILSKNVRVFNFDFSQRGHPRFLEDFIEYYGKSSVKVFVSNSYKEKDVTKKLNREIEKLRTLREKK